MDSNLLTISYAGKRFMCDFDARAIARRTPRGTMKADYLHNTREAMLVMELTRLALKVQWDVDAFCKAVSGVTCRCACCGAVLTDALSTARGVGPECWRTIGGKEISLRAQVARIA